MEDFYENYGIEEVLLGLPCTIHDVNIYPIRVFEWKQFRNYIPYLILSKQHYNIKETDSLLTHIIICDVAKLNNGEYPKDKDTELKLLTISLNNLADMFSILTHEKFQYSISEKEFIFENIQNNKIINSNIFDILRPIVLKQNLLFEPIIYKSKFQQKWAEKVKRGKMKNNDGVEISDIINLVRCEMKISYEEISNENMFQLYSDYRRLNNTKSFDSVTLLKTTYGMEWDKLPKINYTDSIFKDMLTNPELSYFKDLDSSMDDIF